MPPSFAYFGTRGLAVGRWRWRQMFVADVLHKYTRRYLGLDRGGSDVYVGMWEEYVELIHKEASSESYMKVCKSRMVAIVHRFLLQCDSILNLSV